MKYIIDVRTSNEFNDGHYDNALHHDLSRMEAGELPKVDKVSEIQVYCRRGMRAEKAKSILEENGFINVTNIGGYKS